MSSQRLTISCHFDRRCGELFTCGSELLDHFTVHLGEDTVIEELHDEQNGNRILEDSLSMRGFVMRPTKLIVTQTPVDMTTQGTSGLISLDNIMSPSTSPSRGLETEILGLDAPPLYSELDVMMSRSDVNNTVEIDRDTFEAEAESESEDPLALSNPVNMDQILQPPNPCLELVSSEPLPVLDNSLNWSELLQNYPSAVDIMDYEDIMDASATVSTPVKIEAEEVYSAQLSSPHSASKLHDFADAISTEDDEAGESSDESFHSHSRSRTGKDLGRFWLPIPQGKPARYLAAAATARARHFPELKYKRGHARNGRNEQGKEGFRQELVTFVTTEKRTYRALVTTPRSKPKQQNRKTNQQNNQEVKYYSAEFILEEGLKKKRGNSHALNKPYVCPVPGCGKSYKNPNGIKYHARYGHSAPQEFPCHCGKIYSTRHGLMAHKRTHSALNSPQSMEDESLSYSETEESEEYRSNEII